MKNLKKFAALGMAGAMTLSMLFGAAVAANNETISAILNRNIKITYNGEVQTFKDAQGNVVYPISYNGTTYLPVRAVSGLVDLPIDWDGATNTVSLGTNEKQPVSLVSRPNSGATKYAWIINDPDQLTFSGSDANQTYKNGTVHNIWNGSMSSSGYTQLLFDVTGYTKVSFTVACEKEANIRIYDQDGKVLSTFEFPGGIASKTINLNGATKIALAADGKGESNKSGTSTYVYFYEPTLS